MSDWQRLDRRMLLVHPIREVVKFLPALIACAALGLTSKRDVGLAIGIGIAAWALTALFDRDRRFLHDRLAGTRIVALPKRR